MTARNRLAKSEAQPKRTAQEWCDIGNARLAGLTAYKDGVFRPRDDVHWFIHNGQATIGLKLNSAQRSGSLMDRRGEPMSEADTFALNTELESVGAKASYRRDGTRYQP